MTIIGLQRRLHEAGRIRIGVQVESGGGKRPHPAKLDTFRLTSSNRAAIELAAQVFGGDATEWTSPNGQEWQVITEATELPVLVPPAAMSFSQYMELWSGGGCLRRCNGEAQIPGGEPCVCDLDDPDADPNQTCKPHTRISLMLAGLPGSGLWRLDTQGWNAAKELGGAVELGRMIAHASGQSLIPGTLRLEQRQQRRPGETLKRFSVPILDFAVDLPAIAAGEQVTLAAVRPVPQLPAESIESQLAAVDEPPDPAPRRNQSEPVKASGLQPRPAAAVPEDGESGDIRPITEPQRRRLFAIAKGNGITEEQLRAVVAMVCKNDGSTADMTRDQYEEIIAALKGDD